MNLTAAPTTEPSAWTRAAEMLAAILAIVGSAALLAAGKVYPPYWARVVRKQLAATECFVRALLLEEAQKLKVRLFKARGPRPPPASGVESVKVDPLAFRRLMLGGGGLVRIAFPLPQAVLPPEEWNVRFCALGRAAATREDSHVPPASSRPALAKPLKYEPYAHEKTGRQDAGGTCEPRLGPRPERKGPKYFGEVRIYQSKYNEARETAWAAYWLTQVDQKPERPEPEETWAEPCRWRGGSRRCSGCWRSRRDMRARWRGGCGKRPPPPRCARWRGRAGRFLKIPQAENPDRPASPPRGEIAGACLLL